MNRYCCTVSTPLGEMMAASEREALIGLWFTGQKYYPAQAGEWSCAPDYPPFPVLRAQLAAYFTGELREFDLPLSPQGSPFQQSVWKLLLQIPAGAVTTYGATARQLAEARGLSSFSAQAVGGAVGHNPISLIIPCHRVVGTDRSLTGYAGGLDRKERLLRQEGVPLTLDRGILRVKDVVHSKACLQQEGMRCDSLF